MALSTDHVSLRSLRRRRNQSQKNGERMIVDSKNISVVAHADFRIFCANVAYALRRYIKYRSDGGRTARALVQLKQDAFDGTGSLENVHANFFAGLGPWYPVPGKTGDRIRLYANLHRRPSDRLVAFITFSVAVSRVETTGDDLDADSGNLKRTGRAFLVQSLRAANTFSGDRGARLGAYLRLAQRMDYPNYLKLWYYSPAATKHFALRANDEERAKQIEAGGGQMPLKGEFVGPWQGNAPKWRVYPFVHRLQAFHGGSYRTIQTTKQTLNALDQDIALSITNLRQAGATLAGSETNLSEYVLALRHHIGKELMGDEKHLYHLYNTYTKDRRSLFNWL